MGFRVKSLFAFLAGSCLAAGASAADLPGRQPPPAPSLIAPAPPTWEGFYAGTIVGGGYTTFRSHQTVSGSTSQFGAISGGLVGYNFQSGPYVYGVEGDMTLHLIRGRIPGQIGLLGNGVDNLYSIHGRARLGYDFGQFLPFVAGGVAINETYLHNSPSPVFYGDTRRSVSWTIGAGVDVKLTAPYFGPFVLRGEYLYEDFPERSYNLFGGTVFSKQGTHYVRAALIWGPEGGFAKRQPSVDVGEVDWSGSYGGLIAGGSWVRPQTSAFGAKTSFTASGALGGLYLGRNIMLGRWLVGLESDIAATDFSGRGPQAIFPSTSYRNYLQADLRARFGYAFGRFLPFLAVGQAWGRSEQRDLQTGSEKGRVPTEAITIGAGLDYRLSDRISLRGEYLYETTYANAHPDLNGCACQQSRHSHTIRAGAAYHFW